MLYYVGRTICTMRTRFNEHRRLIEDECTMHSVPWHFSAHHDEDPKGLELFSIEANSMQLLEGKRFYKPCQREAF